jgi:hypothetical protein
VNFVEGIDSMQIGHDHSAGQQQPDAFTFEIEGRDFLAIVDEACALFVRESFARHVAPNLKFAVPVLALALAWFIYEGNSPGTLVATLLLAIAGAFWPWVVYVYPNRAAARIRRSLTADGSVVISLIKGRILARARDKSPSERGEGLWRPVAWASEQDEYFLLGLDPMSFIVLPKTGRSDEELLAIRANACELAVRG